MSNLAETIRHDLKDAVKKDQLELPTLPEVSLKIREAAENDDVSATSLAKVALQDPAVAAKLIKVANSPIFRAVRTIDNLQTAIGRIGVEYAANLAVGLAMEQMFQATTDMIDRKLRAVWSHACEVAAISSVLAKSFTKLRPDQASLAGLTHSIGVLPILSFIEERDIVITDNKMLDQIIDGISGGLGTMILQTWDFPAEMALVPSQHTDFERCVASTDYTDLVMVANLQVLANTNHPYTDMDWSTIRAFRNVGIDPSFGSEDSEDAENFGDNVAAAKTALC